jgi:hypothetical protein
MRGAIRILVAPLAFGRNGPASSATRAPSSTGACQTALNLTEHVLPPVPLRQGVFTLRLPRLAYDAPLLGAVTRLFVDSLLGWYQRHLRTSTRELAQSGAVVAVRRLVAL